MIYTGEQLIITDPIVQEYKLEIIAEGDGHKDYTTVNSENPFKLESLSPNPTSNQVLINYHIQGAVSAYIIISNLQATISNNYIIETTQSAAIINLSGYVPALYVVTLVCDGEVVESKNLIIQ